MDWKFYICDFLNHYLPMLELEELVDLTKTTAKKKKKKKKKTLSDTFCVGRCAFLFFFYLPTLELEELVD